jgi:hypothetical protein
MECLTVVAVAVIATGMASAARAVPVKVAQPAAVSNDNYAPHVIEESGGTWGKLLVLPGLPHPGLINSVSCAKPGWCAAGGSYALGPQTQAIISDEKVP